MPDGLRLALTTLTVLPVRGPAALDRRTAGTAMTLAPLVGVPLALVAAAVGEAVHAAGASLLAAVLVVVVLALLTRGLHLDGLADTVDGLSSYRPPEQALAVMRSPEVGPLGVSALVLVLLTQVSALLACERAGRGAAAVLVAVVTARLVVTLACTAATPAASPTGLGALVAETVPRLRAAVALGLVLVASVAVSVVEEDLPLWLGPLAVTAAVLGAGVLRRHAVRRLGGITGDVLGALVETSTAVALVVLAVG
ncbi:MAG TPA: adenosylcobinamide-GDP ribazoletransferase [Mycobacteriales bacterium]|nr:adenosylcobinamide-GDP ribazoletransferase [Mycobacteriales bacterium]